MKFYREANQVYGLNDQQQKVAYANLKVINEKIIDVRSVFVDESLRGQGTASLIMHEVYNHAKENKLLIIPTCPYAVVWFKRNPDKKDVLYQE